QVLDDRRLQALTGVIGGDPDLHATVARTFSISTELLAPSRTILTWSVAQPTTVDERPPGVLQPTSTSEMRPSSCAITACRDAASVGKATSSPRASAAAASSTAPGESAARRRVFTSWMIAVHIWPRSPRS